MCARGVEFLVYVCFTLSVIATLPAPGACVCVQVDDADDDNEDKEDNGDGSGGGDGEPPGGSVVGRSTGYTPARGLRPEMVSYWLASASTNGPLTSALAAAAAAAVTSDDLATADGTGGGRLRVYDGNEAEQAVAAAALWFSRTGTYTIRAAFDPVDVAEEGYGGIDSDAKGILSADNYEPAIDR